MLPVGTPADDRGDAATTLAIDIGENPDAIAHGHGHVAFDHNTINDTCDRFKTRITAIITTLAGAPQPFIVVKLGPVIHGLFR